MLQNKGDIVQNVKCKQNGYVNFVSFARKYYFSLVHSIHFTLRHEAHRVQIQKEVISDLMCESQFLSEEILKSTVYD
jgi:hypothetical protein